MHLDTTINSWRYSDQFVVESGHGRFTLICWLANRTVQPIKVQVENLVIGEGAKPKMTACIVKFIVDADAIFNKSVIKVRNIGVSL